MDTQTVNVLVTYPSHMFTPEQSREIIAMIESVDPAVKAVDAAGLAQAEQGGDGEARVKLDALLADTAIIYGFPPPENVIARAPQLKWMQTPLTGADPFLRPDIIASPVLIANSRGIHGTQAGELVLMLMLMLAKRARDLFQRQSERSWQVFHPGLLHSRTVGILGFGSIGRDVARLARAFGMKVIATRRRHNADAEPADIVLPPQEKDVLLAESDFVVVTVPLTAETEGMIGKREMATMKPTAYLINIARGGVVDEDDLADALGSGTIAGAALDVFATEPLPPQSRLWDLPNAIITPHIAGRREDYYLLATGAFCDNLRRYLKGEELVNIIDKDKGY